MTERQFARLALLICGCVLGWAVGQLLAALIVMWWLP